MTSNRLWFGPIAAVLLFAGIFVVGLFTPGYSHVRQTVSELGEVGAPGQVAFSVLLCLVAACLIIFAGAVARSLRESGSSALPAYFVGAMAISTAGVGIFSFPQPLHNIFGMSETVGYQAPLFAALVCKMDARGKRVKVFSIVMYIAVLLAIAVNLIPLVRPAGLWVHLKPFFGVVQRSLFAVWFIWCVGYALLLMRVDRANDSLKRTAAE
jgi:hypothetical membrane protein